MRLAAVVLSFSLTTLFSFVASAASSIAFTEVYREAIRSDPDFGATVVPVISSTITATLHTNVPNTTFNKKTPWDISFGNFEVSGVLSNDVKYTTGRGTATFPFKDPFTGQQTGFISMTWRQDVFVLHVTCNSDLLDVLDLYAGATGPFSDVTPMTIIVGKFTNNANIYYHGRNSNRTDPVSELSLDTGNAVGIADFVQPAVAIGSPGPNYTSANSGFNVAGSAADNITVASVLWRWALPTDSTNRPLGKFEDWQPVDTQGGSLTRATWITAVDMSYNGPGTNIFWVTSQDAEGHFAPLVIRPFFYSVPSTITLQTTGNGVIRGGPGVRDQANLIIQRRYSVVAVPSGTNNVFLNWTDGNGVVVSVNPRYDFLMQDSLVLQANFGPNPFPEVAGIYNGIFAPGSGINENDSGMLSLTLGTRGAYTGTISLDTGIYRFSGQFQFHTSGSAAVDSTFQVKVRGGQTLIGTLHLPGNGTGLLPTLTGTISLYDPALSTRVIAPLTAGYCPGNAGPVRPGLYNFQIPTANGTLQNGPLGYGCGSVLVRSNGTALTVINVADSNPQVTCNGVVTQDGRLPICASLYAGKGLFIGWLRFSDQATTDLQGENIHWFKRRSRSAFYPDGFQRAYDGTVPNVSGSYYTPPKPGTNVLGWTTATISFADFVFSNSDSFTFDPVRNLFSFPNGNPDRFRIIVLPTTGSITGTFSAFPIKPLRAVILPKSNTILGYFLDQTQTGFVTLTNP